MNKKELEKFSVALCYWLRHNPDDLGIPITIDGYVVVDDLLALANKRQDIKGLPVSRQDIEHLVAEDKKSRYTLTPTMLRCNQGHSTPKVDIKFEALEPPETLYHGTATKNRDSILASGLHSGSRQYVHLSDNLQTAGEVGRRHGELLVFTIPARKLHQAGQKFYRSDNGVWLTLAVDPQFLTEI